ncbi:Nn.00g092880.m01.CDS01 [Neocucurbitaria sp. VM-36]
MHSLNIFLAVLLGLLAILSSASPTSFDSSLLTKDWTHVVPPGATRASITFTNMLPEDKVRGELHNRCPFPVYVRQAIAATSSGDGARCENGGSETQEVEVSPGKVWQTPFLAKMDQCGHSIKITRTRGNSQVYQVEYSMDSHDRRLWYNLSAENGAPFQDVDRWLGARGEKCPFVHCAPGQWGKDPVHGCDWSRQPSCNTIGSVVAILCG